MWYYLMGLVWVFTATPFWQEPLDSGTLLLAQRKPYDRGNCFLHVGCRGESMGATWIDTPASCKALGGKSWMDRKLKCHNLPAGM